MKKELPPKRARSRHYTMPRKGDRKILNFCHVKRTKPSVAFTKLIASTFLLSGLLACSPFAAIVNHSPSLAAENAGRFAELAFVKQDFGKAYGLLSESGKGYGSAEKFREFIIEKHRSAFPSFLKATAYEPVPEQTKINIYLYGENGAEKFYYRMITEGTQESGYRVSGFDRKNIPYTQSDLIRPFN